MIIALNNKCNLDKEEFLSYQEKLKEIKTNHNIILCPSTTNISLFSIDNISLGSQNVSSTEKGSYTGEVAASQLKSFDVKYCIVGHSERRLNQNENLEEIYNKLNRLFEVGITPILCIGETKEERTSHRVEEVLEKELLSAIENLSLDQQEKLIVAYEPIWSIGTGLIPTTEEITEVIKYIKKYLPNTKVLYGGSVTDDNISNFKEVKEIDGLLIGGLSLKPDKLKSLVNQLN